MDRVGLLSLNPGNGALQGKLSGVAGYAESNRHLLPDDGNRACRNVDASKG